MARGNNKNIPSGTGVLVPTIGTERQTILVLNPNNGILYVKINQMADPVTWDWVVPSQSRAFLPGPWLETGLFYVDQSGAGATGNVTVYETDQKYDVPDYAAIGVARLALQTSMDITETSTLPANPGSGIARLWASGTDYLNILNSAGINRTVVDEKFISSLPWALRVNSLNGLVTTGEGLELLYDPNVPSGYIYSYNRGSNVWRNLQIQGLNFTLGAVATLFLNAPAIDLANVGSQQLVRLGYNIFGGAITTTSGSFVPIPDSISYTPKYSNSVIFAVYTGSFNVSGTPGNLAQIFLGINGVNSITTQMFHNPGPNYAVPITCFAVMTNTVANTAITVQPYWAITGGATLSYSNVRGIMILEFCR